MEEAAGGTPNIVDGAPPPKTAEGATEGGGKCCAGCAGSFGSSVARVATGGAWRKPGRARGQGECRASLWAPEGPTVIVTFRPDGVEGTEVDVDKQITVTNPAKAGHSAEQKRQLKIPVAERDMAGRGALQRPTTCGGGSDDGGSSGVTPAMIRAADKDAAAHCGHGAAGAIGRGGRGRGGRAGGGRGGNGRGCCGGGGHGWGGAGGTRPKLWKAAVQLQSTARGMLARGLRARLVLERRQAAARARLVRREAEEQERRKTRKAERKNGRKAEEHSLEVAGASVAVSGVDEAKMVAEVDARWRDWLAAVRASSAEVNADLHRRLHEAEAARIKAEAAAVRAEAGRAEMAAECEGMAEAMVRQAVAADVAAKSSRRKLVVVEECEWEAEAGTQTEALSVSAAAMQTEAVEAVGVAVAAVQTEAVETAEESRVEMVVGRQLHPAQAKAVERAERAAAQIERMQAEAAATAARYRAASERAVPLAESDGRKTAKQVETALSATRRGQNTPTGGRQLKKAQQRRQAAAAGVDVLHWTASKERRRQELAEAERGGRAWQTELEQRLDAAHEEWRQRQQRMQQDGAYEGEAQASVRFWQAAWHSGISLMDVPD